MQVMRLMSENVISSSPDDTVSFAARQLKKYNLGSLPVVKDGRLEGIVTDRDITLRCVAADADPQLVMVRDIMSTNVVSISPDADIKEAARLMADRQIRRLPVVKDGSLVGMFSLGDMATSSACDLEAADALTEISAPVFDHYK
jgi:CBS domain-containing protein